MKKFFYLIVCLTCTAPLLASGENNRIIAEYKGGKLTSQEMQKKIDILSENSDTDNIKINFDQLDQKTKENLITNEILSELLSKEAKKKNLQDSAEYKVHLKQIENELLQKTLLSQIAKKEVTEDTMKARYQQMIAKKSGEEEIKVSHILVDTEGEAKQILQTLKSNKASFAELAKEKSKDPGSKSLGGELGYFTKGQMVPAFEEAAFKLEVNQISNPVKTDFGWHIIKLYDRRKITLPEYNKIKNNIKSELESEAIQNYLQGEIAKAEIKFNF